MEQHFICINCPVGCTLTVQVEDGAVVSVEGNRCARGVRYAQTEAVAPQRMLTSTVCLSGGNIAAVPVKTSQPIPKDKILEVMRTLKGVQLPAPTTTGQIVVENAAQTGTNWVVTRSLSAKQK